VVAGALKRVAVFCGSSTGNGTRYLDAAVSLGRLLAGRGIGLVYGGAHVGTMGAVADAVMAAGGEVVGVMPEGMQRQELAHQGLTELHIVANMHERKAMMAERADAFLALPGGAGTLDELFEIWTWAQIGLHDKPIGLVDVAGFYQPLLRMVGHMIAEGFTRPGQRDLLTVDPDPAVLLDTFADLCTPGSPGAHNR
jgi:uncharacterized protein (TIGR00730 family)